MAQMGGHRQIDIAIKKSGTVDILSVSNREDADHLHDYLKDQGCQVGEIFAAGEYSFFAYSARHSIRDTVKKHGGYCLIERSREVEQDGNPYHSPHGIYTTHGRGVGWWLLALAAGAVIGCAFAAIALSALRL
jgi:hypothetical protein